MLLSSFGQATNDSISLFSSNPIQSDTYKRLEVGDTVNLDTWFSTLGISGATYKIIDGRVGTINGSTLTTTNWGKTQVTATSSNNFRVIILEVRPKGAVAMPMVSAGTGSIYALKFDGSVWSWGRNDKGQLGRWTGDPNAPGRVTKQDGAYLTRIVQIAAGELTAYALDANGNVWAWGHNSHGELGNGYVNNPANAFYAAQVVTGQQNDASGYLQNIVSIAAGLYTSYAITITDDTLAWGWGGGYALGTGSASNTPSPTYIVGWANGTDRLQNILSIDAEYSAAIFLLSDGTVFASGYNSSYGGLGNDKYRDASYPVQVRAGGSNSSDGNLRNIVEIAVCGFSNYTHYNTFLALNVNKEVYSWGCGWYYTAGHGDRSDVSAPKKITAFNGINIIHLSAANDHTGSCYHSALAITEDGKTYTWGGSKNDYGHLGNGTFSTLHTTPKPAIQTAFDLVTVTAGSLGYTGVKADGFVWGWGWNGYGQLGDGTTTKKAYAIPVGGQPKTTLRLYDIDGNKIVSTITLDETQTLQIDFARTTESITSGLNLLHNEYPAVGNISLLSNDTSIVSINPNTGIITPNKNKRYGEAIIIARTAAGVTGMIRVRIKPNDAVTMPMVSAGIGFNIALKANGSVWSWGSNVYGQLGRSNIKTYLPGRVIRQDGSSLSNIVQVAAGQQTAYALDKDGHMWAWGFNGNGELGIGRRSDGESIPYAVQVLTGEQKDGVFLQHIIRIAAGNYTGYAITEDGEALAWGWGSWCTLGTGNTQYHTTSPTYISGRMVGHNTLRNVLDINSGTSVAMFLLANGTVFASGYNSDHGGLGNTAVLDTSFPVQVAAGESNSSGGFLENIIEVDVADYTDYTHYSTLFALSINGEVYSWGFGDRYTTGLGNTTNYPTPKKIPIPAGEKVLHIAATHDYTNTSLPSGLAVTESGKTYTWGGIRNTYGHLGNGTTTTLHTTPKLTTATAFNLVTVSGGGVGYSTVKQSGSVWTWGYNNYGQIGTGRAGGAVPQTYHILGKDDRAGIEVNDAVIYRGSSAAAAYGADAGAAGTQCPGELWLSAYL